MSKLFKVLVNIIIVVCILSVVALIVPPLVGVEESISGPQMDTNVPEGTVLYGTKLPVSMLAAGEEIVYEGDGYLYLYRVNEVDTANGEVHVLNEASGEQSVLQLSKSTVKKALAVPFIGYIMIATRSTEGIAMLISAAVVLILLALVAELWRKKSYPDEDDDDDDDDEEDEKEYFSDIARNMETGTEYEAQYNAGSVSAAEAGMAAAAGMAALETAAESQNAADHAASEEADGRTIVIPSDIEETAEEAVRTAEEAADETADAEDKGATQDLVSVMQKEGADEDAVKQTEMQAAQASAAEVKASAETASEKKKSEDHPTAVKSAEKPVEAAAKKEPEVTDQASDGQAARQPAAYSSEDMDDAFERVPEDRSAASLNISDEEIPDVSNALVAALASTQVSRSDRMYQQSRQPAEEAPQEPADEIELAIPVLSAEEILDAAYANGEDPRVTKDEVTGVTLIDFSECLEQTV